MAAQLLIGESTAPTDRGTVMPPKPQNPTNEGALLRNSGDLRSETTFG